MQEEKIHIYRGIQVKYCLYGENNQFSCTGSFRIQPQGLMMRMTGIPQSTLNSAEKVFLELIEKKIDENIE